MKRNYLLLLMGICALIMSSQTFNGQWSNVPFKSIAKADIGESVDDVEPIVIIDEDFSLFTEGTEENPDATDITTDRYRVKNKYTHLPEWIGYNVHQAGGVCALLEYNHPQFGKGYGYISTPEMELYGETTVTFKCRRAYSNPENGKLWLALCDNTSGPLDDITFELTDEWQEFTWSTSKAELNDKCIFQFTPQQGEILLDDVKVIRKRTILRKVEVLEPINNSPTEFVAQWEPAEEKEFEGYLLNVFYKDWPEEIIESGNMLCDFESINLKDDGQTIDTENPGYPEGWTIDVNTFGTKDMCTENGNYNSGSKAINFDAVGDSILTPEAPAPINRLSFWVKPSTMEQESYEFSLINIQVKSNGKWTGVASIPNYWMEEEGAYYVLEREVLGEYVTQIKLLFINANKVTFAIDDIQIDYATQMIPYPLVTDRFTTETNCVISDIDPTKEHYYNVRVKDGSVVSAPSKDMWVNGLIGLKPEVMQATEITETSFVANWEPLHMSEQYKVYVTQEFVTTTNDEEVELAYEDFSAIKQGSLNNPKEPAGTNFLYLVDEGYSEQDWLMTNPSYANGHAGSSGTSGTGIAGLVLSPKLKLGANVIKVEYKAYNQVAGDRLFIMIIKDYFSSQAEAAVAVEFDKNKSDYISGEVYFEDLDFGAEPMHIAFMTEGGAFLVDEVKISAIVPLAGTTVERPYRILFTDNSSIKVDRIRKQAQYYRYYLKAMRTKDFIDYESDLSDEIRVDLYNGTDIEEITATDNNRVYAADGELYVVIADEDKCVEVFNLQGIRLLSAKANVGNNIYDLPSGLYVVRVADKVYKVKVD